MVSALVSGSSAVWVRALAGDIVFCSWALHLILTVLVLLSTQVYKWVPAWGNPAMDWHPIQGGVEVLLVASCHRNRSQAPDALMGQLARMRTLPNPS